MNPYDKNLVLVSAVFLAFVCRLGSETVCLATETCPTNVSGPDICVDWNLGGTPLIFTNFEVDYATDAANPSVTLKTGAGWNVRSDAGDGAVGNIGDIKIDATVLGDDFELSILDSLGGSAAGAANVGLILLEDTDVNWTGYSSITNGIIEGNLTGNLTVVQDSSDVGGEVTLTIEGAVNSASTITIPVLKNLTIKSTLSGDINIQDKIDNGTLWVNAAVASTASITIADLVGACVVDFSNSSA